MRVFPIHRLSVPCLVVLLVSFTQVRAAEGPLLGLPSVGGEHIARIAEMGDDSWMELGAPKADGKWGRARGRAWGARMAFAADLGGAFLFGEGVHGFVKPDGHYMDDLWFYDLNGHRWICCWPGADTKNISLKINEEGFEADATGQPIPVAAMVHAYENLTYDGDLKTFMFMPCSGEYWKKSLGERRAGWMKDAKKVSNASPWMYSVEGGKWERRVTKEKCPPSGFGDVFVYVPSMKKSFFWHGEGVWFYDGAENSWSEVKAVGKRPPFGIDATACYDAKRERIYMGGGSYPVVKEGENALWIFDLKKREWMDAKPEGNCGSNSYNTNISVMEYDGKSDRVLVFRHGGEKKEVRGIWVYDPNANSWASGPLKLPEWRGQCKNGYYDSVLNVYVFHCAGDSAEDGVIWVYRYRK